LIITSPVDFNLSLTRGKPIATSPRPSKTGTLHFSVELVGKAGNSIVGVGLGIGSGVGVGDGEVVGDGIDEGEGIGVGDGED
jgi:hypothetical protein